MRRHPRFRLSGRPVAVELSTAGGVIHGTLGNVSQGGLTVLVPDVPMFLVAPLESTGTINVEAHEHLAFACEIVHVLYGEHSVVLGCRITELLDGEVEKVIDRVLCYHGAGAVDAGYFSSVRDGEEIPVVRVLGQFGEQLSSDWDTAIKTEVPGLLDLGRCSAIDARGFVMIASAVEFGWEIVDCPVNLSWKLASLGIPFTSPERSSMCFEPG